MLADINHLNIGPRMDGGPRPFDPNNGKLKLTYDKANDILLLEILDIGNPEFQVKVMFT